MTDDLVKRLRNGTVGDKERHEAADLIEKLEEDVGVLIAASIRLSSRIDLDSDHYVDRIEKLEAALRKIDRSECLHPHDIVETARKALTEGKDD